MDTYWALCSEVLDVVVCVLTLDHPAGTFVTHNATTIRLTKDLPMNQKFHDDPFDIEDLLSTDIDNDSKLCTGCGENFPLIFFHRDNSKPDGYKSHCKECRSFYAGRYYTRDGVPEKLKESVRRQREEEGDKLNKERLDLLDDIDQDTGTVLSPWDIDEILGE